LTLRAELLGGRRVAMAGGGPPAIAARMAALGATVELMGPDLADEEQAAAWARDRAPLAAAVIDARAWFGSGGAEALRRTLELAWGAARAVATGALAEGGEPSRLLFIIPAAHAGRHAEAARAGLENLTRTLSVEWARFAITTVAIAPGPATTEAELAELVSFVASAAGGYLSGCRLDLGAVPVAV
jgi:hypothetical protein